MEYLKKREVEITKKLGVNQLFLLLIIPIFWVFYMSGRLPERFYGILVFTIAGMVIVFANFTLCKFKSEAEYIKYVVFFLLTLYMILFVWISGLELSMTFLIFPVYAAIYLNIRFQVYVAGLGYVSMLLSQILFFNSTPEKGISNNKAMFGVYICIITVEYILIAIIIYCFQVYWKKRIVKLIQLSQKSSHPGFKAKIKKINSSCMHVTRENHISKNEFWGHQYKTTGLKDLKDCLKADPIVKGQAKHGGNIKVLLVDDNFADLKLAAALLKKSGVECISASSGTDCIRWLKRETFDFVLLDYMMQEMDGQETIQEIRSLNGKSSQDIPVIVLLPGGMIEQNEIIGKGFQASINKPFDAYIFQDVVENFLSEI